MKIRIDNMIKLKHDYFTTYEQLKTWINSLSPEQLRQTATVYFEEDDEGYPISFIRHMMGSDVYDDGQLVMSVDAVLPE